MKYRSEYDENYDESAHEEIYDKYEKRKNKNRPAWIRKADPTIIIIVVAAVALMAWWALKKGGEVKEYVFIAFLIGVLIYILSMMFGAPRLLTEKECKAILLNELIWKQRFTNELPTGNIVIDISSKLAFFDGQPQKRFLGFHILSESYGEIDYVAALEPYTGDILEYKKAATGILFPDDVKTIPSKELFYEKSREGYKKS